MGRFILDLRAALETLRRDVRFTAAVVLTLGLGIAPNCLIFSIMDGVYFRPLPYPAQDRLALVNVSRPSTAAIGEVDPFTFSELTRRASTLESLALYRNAAFDLNPGDRPERVAGQVVTADFFAILGIPPSRGRVLRPADCMPGAPRVLVLSHRAWLESFSGRADIVGLAVRLDGAPASIVGVMPEGFTSFMEGRTARAWAPLPLDGSPAPNESRGGNVIARLKQDAGAERAAAEAASIRADLARQFPSFYRDRAMLVRDFRSSLFTGLGPGIRLLSVVVGLLLIIACANAANLLLARGAQRSREMAIRAALGAGRPQLVRAMLAESLLLAVGGSMAGVAMAWVGMRLLWSRTAPLFRAIGVEGFVFDHRLLVFASALAIVATALFGLLPAWRASRTDIVRDLAGGIHGMGSRGHAGRISRALVAGQTALCVVTMIAGTLVLRSVVHFSGVSANPGFRPESLLIATLPHASDASGGRIGAIQVAADAESRIAALPGVERVALTDRLPFLEGGGAVTVLKQGDGRGEGAGQRIDAAVRAVSTGYFALVSMPLLRGRGFTAADSAASVPVAIISDRLASAYWSGAEPIGDRVQVAGTWRTVVGVVRSSVQPSPFQPSSAEAFVPYLQSSPRDLKVLVRSSRAIAVLAPAIRDQVRAIDPDQPVMGLQTMGQALDDFMTPFFLILTLTVVFGGIALAMAGVGLYGVIARQVAQRRRETGIRIALGARPAEVMRLVVRGGLRLAAIGLAIGMLLGAAVAMILPSEILGVGRLSAWHYAAVLTVWLGVALVACLVPARRASRVPPVTALRCE